jgi:hypothetical protein
MQSLLSGASVGESTFTCLYAHSSVLADMKSRLVPEVDEDVISKQLQDLCIGVAGAPATDQVEERASVVAAAAAAAEGTTAAATATAPKQADAASTPVPAQWAVFASVLALVETTECVRGVVLNADIYEEEDFAANTHGIPFYTEEVILDTRSILKQALKTLQAEESQEKNIVRSVLTFQLHFLSVCGTLAKLSGGGVRKTVLAAQSTARKAVQQLRSLLATMEGLGDDTTVQVKSLLQRSFDSFVNRPRAGNVPVRKISFLEPKEAVQALLTITTEIDSTVCNLLLRGSSLGRIQRMLDRFARSDVNILSRSLLVLNLYFDDKLLGQHNLHQLLVNNMRQWSGVPDALEASEHARTFVKRLAKPVYDVLKLHLLNRNRQRAFLEAVVLPDWSCLEDEAQIVDLQCRQEKKSGSGASNDPAYFSRYVLAYCIRMMDRYVESGMEVGLFHSNWTDLSFAFWYRDFLLSALVSNLTSMLESKEASRTPPVKSSANKGRGGKKKHGNRAAAAANGSSHINSNIASAEEDVEIVFEMKFLTIKRYLCRKSAQFLAALVQAGCLQEQQQFEFTTHRHIFEKRFEVFGEMRQPPPLLYEHWCEGVDFTKVPLTDLLLSVQEGFQSCRTSLEQLVQQLSELTTGGRGGNKMDGEHAVTTETELRSLIKACVGNAVYVQKLRQLVQSGTKAAVVFDFSGHDQFCTFKVTS